jgi:hypothetical protein
MKKRLDSETKKEHLNRSDIVREALRQYFSKLEFQRLRKILVPQAEKSSVYSDEDVFNLVS